MEEIKTMGLVIREQTIKEADKLLTVLTPEYGKILVSGKGVSSLRSPHMASAQLFVYSSFVFKKTRKNFYIADSSTEECFFNIRYDVEKLALANYFCDVACDLSLENVSDPELLRLMLNTLYAISNKPNLNLDQAKGAFEFRAASGAGYLPMLDECGICGGPLSDEIIFDVMNGHLRCAKCADVIKQQGVDPDGTADITFKLNSSIIAALRFICESPVNKYLSFILADEELPLFSAFTETYLTSHLEHSFASLKYYKSIRNFGTY